MPQVRMPDGTVVAFPDDMPRDQIRSLIERKFPETTADPAPTGSAQFNRAMDEMSAMTQNPAKAQYDALPEWQKPIVAANDLLSVGVNGITSGYGDKAVALARSAFTDKTYDQELAAQRSKTQGARNRAGSAGIAAEIGGAILPAAKAMQAGVTATRFASAAPGAGRLAGVMAGSAVDGAVLGALSATGNDTDVGTGIAVGGLLGGLTPGAFALLRTTAAPLFSRMAPDRAAQNALLMMVSRSGRKPAEIVADLNKAARDGTPLMMADALGNPGQRMLSTIARTPNDARASVVEALERRQAGQGERLANAVARGLNAPDTYAQRAASLTADRSMLANVNYPSARANAGPVDASGAVAAADNVLTPGVNRIANPGSNIADDSLEGVVRRARALLTDGKSVATNFDAVMRAKQDIADMIGRAQRNGSGNQVRILSDINSQLDTALERASPGYRQANDAFRQQSRTIDAVEQGAAAASGRTRAADNIAAFQAMRPGEQMAHRAGYADPLIARIESAAPGVNKARGLINDKTQAELQAFSIPQRSARLQRQIGDEQRMFETRNQALGGSKTADNLADQAEMALFDPTVIGNLLSGNILGAGAAVGRQSLANLQGLSPQVRTRLANMLLTTSPTKANGQIAAAIRQGKELTEREMQTVIRLLAGSTAATAQAQR